MKSITSMISACVFLMAIFSCASAHSTVDANSDGMINETVKIGSFNSVRVSNGIKVVYTQANNPGIAKIETTAKAYKYLKVIVKEDCLNVYFDTKGERNVNIKGKTTVTVSSSVLKNVMVSSSGMVIANGDINLNGDLDIMGSSSGSIQFNNVKCEELDLKLSSSASFRASAVTSEVDIIASSSGSASLNAVTGKELELKSSSSASIEIGTFKGAELEAMSTSSGSITVSKFSGKSLDAMASSSGSVKVKDVECTSVNAMVSSSGRVSLAGKCDNLDAMKSTGGSLKIDGLSVTRDRNIK